MNVRDLAGTGRSEDLLQLLELHRRWFPEYDHIIPELEEAAELPSDRGDIVMHLPFVSIDGRGVGYTFVHTNLNRSIAIHHFMAVDDEFRGRQDAGPTVAEAVVAKGAALVIEDGLSSGRPVNFGMVGESEPSEPRVLRALDRLGFHAMEVDYAEPQFGRYWSNHGEPSFHDMVMVIRANGTDRPRSCDAIQAGCEALLLDYYGLDPDHPRVVTAFASINR